MRSLGPMPQAAPDFAAILERLWFRQCRPTELAERTLRLRLLPGPEGRAPFEEPIVWNYFDNKESGSSRRPSKP